MFKYRSHLRTKAEHQTSKHKDVKYPLFDKLCFVWVSEVKFEIWEQALSAQMSMLCQFQVFSWSVTDLEDSSQLPKMERNNSTHMGFKCFPGVWLTLKIVLSYLKWKGIIVHTLVRGNPYLGVHRPSTGCLFMSQMWMTHNWVNIRFHLHSVWIGRKSSRLLR